MLARKRPAILLQRRDHGVWGSGWQRWLARAVGFFGPEQFLPFPVSVFVFGVLGFVNAVQVQHLRLFSLSTLDSNQAFSQGTSCVLFLHSCFVGEGGGRKIQPHFCTPCTILHLWNWQDRIDLILLVRCYFSILFLCGGCLAMPCESRQGVRQQNPTQRDVEAAQPGTEHALYPNHLTIA